MEDGGSDDGGLTVETIGHEADVRWGQVAAVGGLGLLLLGVVNVVRCKFGARS